MEKPDKIRKRVNMIIAPNVKYKDRLLKAYKLAWESKTGFWNEN